MAYPGRIGFPVIMKANIGGLTVIRLAGSLGQSQDAKLMMMTACPDCSTALRFDKAVLGVTMWPTTTHCKIQDKICVTCMHTSLNISHQWFIYVDYTIPVHLVSARSGSANVYDHDMLALELGSSF